jgi:hypothetical protein
VAFKDASGNLHMDCVTGKDVAAKATLNGKTTKEHKHDQK